VQHLVQEALALVIAHSQEAPARGKGRAPHVTERRLGGGPIGKDRARRHVHHAQTVFFAAARHDQHLAVAVEMEAVGGRFQIHYCFARIAGGVRECQCVSFLCARLQ